MGIEGEEKKEIDNKIFSLKLISFSYNSNLLSIMTKITKSLFFTFYIFKYWSIKLKNKNNKIII